MFKVTVFNWCTLEFKWCKVFGSEIEAEKYADYWFANEAQNLSSTYEAI